VNLLFSDLTSAPTGAYVTVWGTGLGASGTLRVGGTAVDASDIIYWGEDDALGITGLGRIEFRVSFTGESITVDGLTGTIPFTARTTGNVYYVDHDQTSTGVGNGSLNNPWKTLNEAVSFMAAGDVLYVRDSATPYSESGGSYDGVLNAAERSGTSALPIAVVGYPRETPVIVTTSSNTRAGVAFGAGESYWTVAKLSFVRNGSGSNMAIRAYPGPSASSDIRIVGCVVTGFRSANDGAVSINAAQNVQFIGNYIYDTGVSGENNSHAFYHGGFNNGPLYNVELAYNHIRNHVGGRLIQFYAHLANDEIHGVHVHHNKLHDGPEGSTDGILLSRGDGGATYWLKDAHVHHNEIYNIGRNGIYLNAPDAQMDVHDNIAYNSGRAISMASDINNGYYRVYNNCLDEAPSGGVTGKIELTNNFTDYPTCIAQLN
jgi:hypothetical protein